MNPSWNDLNNLACAFLTSISEPKLQTLVLRVEEEPLSYLDDDTEGVFRQESEAELFNPEPRTISIKFDPYVAYCIRAESGAMNTTDEEFTGTLARLYTQSHFLDYIRATSLDSNAQAYHFGLLCIEHIVDVITLAPPTIQSLTTASP